MAISNITNTIQPASTRPIAATGPTQAASIERTYGEQQPAAIVTLSAQSRRLSMEQSQPSQTPTRASQAETAPRTQAQTRTFQAIETPRAQTQTRVSQAQSATQTDKAAVTKVETCARETAEAPITRQQDEVVERKRINTYA